MKQCNDINILIQLIASGTPEQLQRDAFEKLYLFYWIPLRNYAEKRTDDDLIEDLLQDVFSYLWIHRKMLVAEKTTNKSTLEKWLMDTVRSKAANLNKFKKKQMQLEDESIVNEIAEKTTIHSEQTDFAERNEYEYKLQETIGKLPPQLKLVYSLKMNYNYSIKEISSYLSISETQVKESFRKAKGIVEEKMLKTYQIDDFLSDCKIESRK